MAKTNKQKLKEIMNLGDAELHTDGSSFTLTGKTSGDAYRQIKEIMNEQPTEEADNE